MSNKAITFNLLPPKSKEEIASIEERDNSVLYATLLILFAVVIFAVFSIGKLLLIDTRKANLETVVSQLDSRILGYNGIKQINGELFVKSSALSPIVEQDIKLTKLIEVANKLVEGSEGTIITKYARQLDGVFEVTLIMNTYAEVNKISANASQIDSIEHFIIRNLSQQSKLSTVNCTISFKLTNI